MCKNLFCFRTIFDRNFFLIFFHSYFFSRVHPALSVHPSVRWSTRWSVGPSVGLSVRPSVFHTSFFSKFLYFFFHPNCSYKKNNVITSNSTPVPTRAHLGIYVQGLLLFCLPISRSLSFSLFFFFSLSFSLIADYQTQMDITNTSVICCIGQLFQTKRLEYLGPPSK